MSELYNVTSSPHIRAKDSTQRIMLYVIIALLPATVFGIINFGPRALAVVVVSIASCLDVYKRQGYEQIISSIS